ncbi:MAG: SCP-2 sterol transfer family protein [Zetaproteobacteria bacterium]|nr:MAG: SCP-2 sterol transfer family protein [Zetaproteobacteria bacterium]
MTFENIENEIRKKLSYAPEIGAKIKLDFGDGGLLFIDGTQNPAVLSHDDADADTTFVCSLDLFKAIIDGTQDPTMAFMTGKLKIQGSMGYAMKISALLGD